MAKRKREIDRAMARCALEHAKLLLDGRFAAVCGVLMNEWDPIGVRGEKNAADEYDAYALEAIALWNDGAGEADVAAYLLRMETEWMGLRGRADVAEAVAAAVFAALTTA